MKTLNKIIVAVVALTTMIQTAQATWSIQAEFKELSSPVIELQLTDVSSRAMSGFTAIVPSGQVTSREIIGIYQFTGSQNSTIKTLWSTCLSPIGDLGGEMYTYTEYSFKEGKYGKNPDAWAMGTEDDAGIQNAQFLWRLYSPGIIASGTQAQGAGLALAIWEALYDSTGYGAVDAAPGKFEVTSWGTTLAQQTDVHNAYKDYLAGLVGSWDKKYLTTGSVLRSTDIGAGQDLIYIVPEPTTILAGALLLLPFVISTLRILRRRHCV
jgi:hypothetical protein